MVFDLMFSLNATEEQLDFPVIYGSAKNNWMGTDWKTPTDNLTALLDAIIEHISCSKNKLEGTPQMFDYLSGLFNHIPDVSLMGRVHRGTIERRYEHHFGKT